MASQGFSITESASITLPVAALVVAAVFVIYGQSRRNKRWGM